MTLHNPQPYADSVADYALAGWSCILPVPGAAKHPPPVGFTGADGRDTDAAQLVAWSATHAGYSIALRMPDGVIGIDVDHYTKGSVDKRGGDSLAEYEQRWGALPTTWRSSARDLPSGIRFYRVPAGRYATKLGESIEIIQRHHRYAVVWPSPHHEVGADYRWFDPSGVVSATVPKPNELPLLPEAWVAGLREGASEAGPAAADIGRGQLMLSVLLADQREPCAEMTDAARKAVSELEAASSGSRHDTATGRAHHLVQLGATGHPGVAGALAELRELWERLTAGEGRADEYDRMLLTSARKAVTVVGPAPVDRDPCFAVGSVPMAAPAPVDNRAPGGQPGYDVPEPIEAPKELHPFEVIGAHEFDPRGFLDQTLADAVLARTQPVLRYAHDARVWLLRGPDVWDTRQDLSGWAVALLADRMPQGDPEAEKGSDPRDQAERRKKFMTASSSRGIATKMRDRVAGGVHPNTLKLGQLDREPWLMWAGGTAWDLRASIDAPRPAWVDPATPHLHSAAVAPDPRPTPLWDAFLEAVWPDPELRAWALRVLSVTATGYSDKALPIMIGKKDRGKTQVVALIMSVLGTYAHAADARLLGGADKAHASIIYALMGRRLSFIDEGPREGRLGQERLKQLTGGGELTGNAMNQNPVTWAPTHTLVLTANDEPILTDPAVRSRVRLIPCEGDPEEVIKARAAIGHTSGRAWRAEAPGVLAKLMREAAAWLADPSSALTAAAPEAYRYRAEEIASEQDPIATWLTEETEPDEYGERSRALYEAFVTWSKVGKPAGWNAPSETKWGRELTERGYPVQKTAQGNRRPLRLRQHGGGWLPTAGPVPGGSQTNPPSPTPNPPSPAANPPSPTAASGQGRPGKAETNGGLAQSDGGSVEGYRNNPPRTEPQDRGTNNSENGGYGGSTPLPYTYTRAHAQESPGENNPPTLHPSIKATPAKITKAAQKEAERAQARRDAAGEAVPLPAAVGRDGAITGLTPVAAGEAIAAAVSRSGALTVDVETSGYPVGHADYALRTVQLGDEQTAVVLDPADPVQAQVIRAALAAAPRLHAHSATADLVPLVAAGLTDESAWDRMHDTVIPAKLADPTSTGSDPGLKQLAGTVLGAGATAPAADKARAALFKAHSWLTDTKATTPLERSGWAQVDSASSTMIRYAASDVLDTAALAVRLPRLPSEVVDRERAVQRITARVAHRGVRVDREQVSRLEAEHTPAMAAAAERVKRLGVENPGSDRQLADRLTELGVNLPRTQPSTRHPQGQPSVAAGVLEGLRSAPAPAGVLIAAVLEYRHHETVLTTFLEPYRVLCDSGDGRARPTVYTLGTDTGRMSCVRPNLQQLPREGGVRACITADPGHVLVSADFSGVEIRVMAALSQDPELIRILREGADLHAMVAEQAFGPQWTKADRYTAKRGVFGWAYGGGIPSLARQLGVSESVMAAIVDSLRLVAPAYVRWADEMKRQVRAGATQMPTYAGRIIHLPREYPHKAPNYAIQGTARELLVDALLAWDRTRWGGGVVLPVHDEIVAMVPEADAEEATAELARCMARELYGISIEAEASKPSFAWRDSV
ncbi:DNA polymerase [Micromonospora aurantiaca (nom. illeg.)]|uniref:DNA polymerase n=1 Tax=Micromonospora aurantiaca (nom. illeg.) TaxID=47850 RepID=UPI0034097917